MISASSTAAIIPSASASNGLDLLFAASQMTTSAPSDHRQSVPVVYHPHAGTTSTVVSSVGGGGDISNPIVDDGGGDDPTNPITEAHSRSFVQVLMDILSNTYLSSIICWLPDGQSFLIADQKNFEKIVLPSYFRTSLFNSFVRKLNRWGFRRIKRTGYASSFSHDLFVRDKPWLCISMRCQSKPSYKKLRISKVNGDVRRFSLVSSPITFAAVHSPTSSALCSKTNTTNVTLSVTESSPNETTPPSPNSMSNPHERNLFFATIPQKEQRESQLLLTQMRQRQHLQIELQHLNSMAALTNEALTQRYYNISSVTPYSDSPERRNLFCNEQSETS